MNTKERIELFISKIKENYEGIKLKYRYDSDEDSYFIFHNRLDLDFSNKSFINFTDNLLFDLFYKENIENVFFSYDVTEFKETEKKLEEFVNSKYPIRSKENNLKKIVIIVDTKRTTLKESFSVKASETKCYSSKNISLENSNYKFKEMTKTNFNYAN